MPRLLAINTATPAGSVAVTVGGQLLGETTLQLKATHSERLLELVDRLLSDLDLHVGQLDAIAVVQGPGSFTGLRVGMATAKGLALSLGIPLIGVSSLETLASNIVYAGMPVCALLDARKNEVYAGLYEYEQGHMRLVGDERVLTPDELLEGLTGEAVFVGDGAVRYRSVIIRQMGERAHFAPDSFHHPRASIVASLAAFKFATEPPMSPDIMAPVYIRPSDAEKSTQN